MGWVDSIKGGLDTIASTFDPISGFIGGAADAAGAYFQQETSKDIADKQMDFQKAANAKQMEFQRHMSNTAHRRQVNDLKQAGLNPLLSVNSGASTPGGSTSAGAMGQAQNIGGAAVRGAQAATQMENIQANTAKVVRDTSKVGQLEAEFDAAVRVYEKIFDEEPDKDWLMEKAEQFGLGLATTGKEVEGANKKPTKSEKKKADDAFDQSLRKNVTYKNIINRRKAERKYHFLRPGMDK